MNKVVILMIFPVIFLAREWTALVYMVADNDLAQWADSDLVEMETIGSTDDFAILVQVDKPIIGARRLLINRGMSQELQNLGITDMCDWQTLSDFLIWGIQNYPADRYFAILWDHGTGWTLMPSRSFGNDWSSGSQLSISNGDLHKAMSTTYSYTRKKIDFFAFDACLMQQLEVAFEIKDYGKIFLAPQTTCPLQGFRYDQIFEEVRENPDISETDLAKRVVEINVSNYVDIRPVVYSAISLTNLDKLKESMDQLIYSLMEEAYNLVIAKIREKTQTLPVIDTIPESIDEHIDLGDFLGKLNFALETSETENLLNIYNNAIIKFGYCGTGFSNTTGLSIWFPLKYLQFKQLLDNYSNLMWTQSQWPQFLNWVYGEDDIRPTLTEIKRSEITSNNSFHLYWSTSHDLASVVYHVIETEDSVRVFEDQCEDTIMWHLSGFSLSANNAHSGSHSFFSGDASNLQNWIETKNPVLIEDLGLLMVYLYYNTQEMFDSLIIEYGSFKDAHYGWSDGWQKRSIILPSGNNKIRILYQTNNSINKGGCYFDDISIDNLGGGKYIRQNYTDTTLYVFNKVRGEFSYAVYPEDTYNNVGNVSNFTHILVENFALPYSEPNPFQTSCEIILDYPDSLHPIIEIFSISGRRVKRFGTDKIENGVVHWDGRDENNRDVGAGLYFVLLKDGSFRKIGKIARQR